MAHAGGRVAARRVGRRPSSGEGRCTTPKATFVLEIVNRAGGARGLQPVTGPL